MTWIKSDSGLCRSGKFLQLVARLKVGTRDAFWHLHQFWYWVSDQYPDGLLKDIDDQVIALSAEWPGDAKALVDALIDCGFVDRLDGQLSVHDWQDWSSDPTRLKLRRQRAPDKRPTNVGSPQSVDVVLVFPTAGKVQNYSVTTQELQKLTELYPGVNVLIEAKKALHWVETNPSKKKTATGMPRFLASWMERCQNRGGSGRGGMVSKDDQAEIQRRKELSDESDRLIREYKQGASNGRSH